MKSVKLILSALALVSVAAPAFADDSCAQYIKQKVEAQAQIDFKEKLTAELPTIYQDQGVEAVEFYRIPVVAAAGEKPVATYGVLADEVCGILHLYQL
ncbi:MAG: hypothetical protein P4M08_09685 [Oligoflexia bacterium]|nr:hypothetical protein [Oligoflexia bacterium]